MTHSLSFLFLWGLNSDTDIVMLPFDPLFTQLTFDPANQSLPKRFTFPYYYEPHPLAHQAIEELQRYLTEQPNSLEDALHIGRMFGVLVVENQDGSVGYLSSISGENHFAPGKFVPSIFDSTNSELQFIRNEIDNLRCKLDTLNADPDLHQLNLDLMSIKSESSIALDSYQLRIKEAKKDRKLQRNQAEIEMSPEQLASFIKSLGEQSSQEKRQLKKIKHEWLEKIAFVEDQLRNQNATVSAQKDACKLELDNLKKLNLQQRTFLNQHGITQSLYDLLKDKNPLEPIVNSEHENAPKLLQYAFKHRIKPLALAEFWWGPPPEKEVRQHKNLYPVCQSKCFEILNHMLDGIETDPSPLTVNPAEGKELEIVYEDDVMVVVNKPEEFLSVPGKTIIDSVYTRIQARYPKATGPLIVHRLDMSTSGLIVLALTSEANRFIQKQFIERTVEKHYVALLEGEVEAESGIMKLPLAGDLSDRPRQLVCFEHGKNAETTWQVLDRSEGRTRVRLYPKTGRTHQLRVHCAHHLGLNCSIVGDDLYGYKRDRLHLHAEYLRLIHPVTKKVMEFNAEAGF